MQTEFTGTTRAWLTDSRYKSLAELHEILQVEDADFATGYLAYSNHDMDIGACPWVEVGIATVTVKLHKEDKVTGKQVAALKQELQNIRAEAQMKENAILERISKLQSITYDAPASI